MYYVKLNWLFNALQTPLEGVVEAWSSYKKYLLINKSMA